MSTRLSPTHSAPQPAGAPSTPAPRASTTRRALATAGAAGPVVFLAVSVLAGLLKPGYDLRDQSVSELAVGAYGWLQAANFFALGAAMIAAALALALAGRAPRSTIALLGAAGVGMFTVGLVPDDLSGAAPTAHGEAHDTISLGIFLALIAGAALHGRALRRSGVQPRLARYSTLTAGAVFVLFAVFAVLAGDVGDPLHSVSGLLERAFIGVALAWIVVVSGRLLTTPTD
jgi:hypothetical membrane protein